MTFALITFETIYPDNKKFVQWAQILGTLEESLNTHPNIEKIQENVWLIPLSDALQVLNTSTGYAHNMNISYKVAVLEESPKFS